MTRAEAQALCPNGISWQKLRRQLIGNDVVEETRRQYRANRLKKETSVFKLTESFKRSNDIVITTKKKRMRVVRDESEEDKEGLKRARFIEEDNIKKDK
jgi:hypothetical protein